MSCSVFVYKETPLHKHGTAILLGSHKGFRFEKCRNLIKKPWAYNPQKIGVKQGTLIKAQGFLIRFLH